MQKISLGYSTTASTQVLYATYNKWKRPVSGEGNLQEVCHKDALIFPSGKISVSPLSTRSLGRPGNKRTTADSLHRERYQKNHYEYFPKEGSLRRQTKIWTIIMLNFLQSFPWKFLTAKESRQMSLYIEQL